MDNVLYTRLVHAAHTHDGWQSITSTPKNGEVCLEAIESSGATGFKIKIGDGVRKFCVNNGTVQEPDWDYTSSSVLPYFGTTINVSGTLQVCGFYTYPTDSSATGYVEALAGKTVMRIYQISVTESEGEATISIDTSHYKEIRPGTNINFSLSSDTVPALVVNNDADVVEYAQAEWDSVGHCVKVYGIKEENGAIVQGNNTFDITFDDTLFTINSTSSGVTITIELVSTYTNINKNNASKPTTNAAITAALGTLDGNATTQDESSTSLDVINTVSETDGIISSTKKTLSAGTRININAPASTSTDKGKIVISHETITPTVTDNSANPPDGLGEGERDSYVITNITTDNTGHITAYTEDKSSNLIAADIKAPVKVQEDDTWTRRITGGSVNIGEDTARIPELKGNTVVWNQQVENGNFSSTSGWLALSGSTFTIADNTANVVVTGNYSGIQKGLSNAIISGHKYIIISMLKSSVSTNMTFGVSTSSSGSPIRHQFEVATSFARKSFIGTASADIASPVFMCFVPEVSSEINFYIKNVQLIDLTKLFGSDAEICSALGVANLTDAANLTLAAQNFEKLYPNSYYPYCEGKVVSLGGYPIKWNQLYDTTVPTAVTGHKYYLSEVVSSTKTSSISTTISYTSGSTNRMCIDLTLMFGAGNEPNSVAEVESMFPNDYYEYNTGTEMNILDAMERSFGIESIGFNRFNPETHTADVLAGEDYYVGGTYTSLAYSDGTAITVTNNTFTATKNDIITVTGYGNDTIINISDPSRDGTYFPYKKDTLNLDWVREIEYTPTGSDTPVKLFPFGINGRGTLIDNVTSTKAIKRWGIVDLGSLNLTYSSDWNGMFYCVLSDMKKGGIASLVCSYYNISTQNNDYSNPKFKEQDKVINANNGGLWGSSSNRIFIKDSSLSTTSGTKSELNGQYLIYELATPVELDLTEPHDMTYFVDDLGTETELPTGTASPVNAPFVGTFEYYSNFKGAVLDLIDKVNAYRNPVRGINNTDQTDGKLAVYDSKETVKSSEYSVWTSDIDTSRTDNNVLLPSIDILIDYVNTVLSSALTYKGVISDNGTALPSSGQETGDMWAVSDVYTYNSVEYYGGTFFIWNGDTSSWDIVQGTTSVTDNNITLSMNGVQQTVATIDGQSIHITSPTITNSMVSGLNTSSHSFNGIPHTVFTPSANDDILLYAPITAGTSGNVVVSSGSGAPSWNTLENAFGKKALGYALLGNGTGVNDSVVSWRGLLDQDFDSTNTNTGFLKWTNGTGGAAGSWSFDNTVVTTGNFSTEYPDLNAIEILTGTNGYLRKTAANTWELDPYGGSSVESVYSNGNSITPTTTISAGLKKAGATPTYQKISTSALVNDTVDTLILDGNFS